MAKQIVYVDMDNVLVDFPSAFSSLSEETMKVYEGRLDEVPGIFSLMKPIEGAIEAYRFLAEHFDVYILSTAPWKNSSAWSDKLLWVQKYLGDVAYKRLILTHHKDLNRGDYLIDDRTKNGASEFQGQLIQLGSEQFPSWETVVNYFKKPYRQRRAEERKKTLIPMCRFYKGEAECPKHLQENDGLLWDYERHWVEALSYSYRQGEEWRKTAEEEHLEAFAKKYDIPATLVGLLFNRFMHWSSGHESSEDFYKWMEEYYLKLQPTSKD